MQVWLLLETHLMSELVCFSGPLLLQQPKAGCIAALDCCLHEIAHESNRKGLRKHPSHADSESSLSLRSEPSGAGAIGGVGVGSEPTKRSRSLRLNVLARAGRDGGCTVSFSAEQFVTNLSSLSLHVGHGLDEARTYHLPPTTPCRLPPTTRPHLPPTYHCFLPPTTYCSRLILTPYYLLQKLGQQLLTDQKLGQQLLCDCYVIAM